MLRRAMMAALGVPPYIPESTIYLDNLATQPRAVLSLRKLVSTATTSIRVRRSSDSAEQDIGFAGNALDTAALLAFAGAGSAYVTKVYDQSGNLEHAEQATAANQPRIVNAGVYDGEMVFNGTSHSLKITALGLGGTKLAMYANIRQANSATSKIIFESSANYNTANQSYLAFIGSAGWSVNMANTAGAGQRQNLYVPTSITAKKSVSALWDRLLTGSNECKFFVDGEAPAVTANQTVEATGTFGTHDAYIGARGGASLFADMGLETLVIYHLDSAAIRQDVETAVATESTFWARRLNAPTSVTKIGSTYFLADCWHHRVLYTDDITKAPADWSVMENKRLQGPHSIAYDGYMYVIDDTDGETVCAYVSDGAGGFTFKQELTVATAAERPHRVVYDAGTNAFYVINAMSQEILKLTRSGDVLSIAHTVTLAFLAGQYTRSLSIIDGKMYFVAEPGKIFEVSFNGSSTYTLLNTYNLPAGMSSPNDVFKSSAGDWYATATSQKIIKFATLAGMHAGTYTDVYATFGLAGTPYFLSEFDGAIWIPEIIERNGLTKVVGTTPTLIHNYGTENASSLYRHNNAP